MNDALSELVRILEENIGELQEVLRNGEELTVSEGRCQFLTDGGQLVTSSHLIARLLAERIAIENRKESPEHASLAGEQHMLTA